MLAAAVLLHGPILYGIARLLEVREEPVPGDVIFLHGGDAKFAGRAQQAAELYHRGYAPRILLPQVEDPPAAFLGLYPNDTDVNVAILRRAGVPATAIGILTVPGGATSTRDEARILAAYLRSHPVDRVLLVTNEFHTRRARWLVRRAMGDLPVEVRISGARDPRFDASDWWRSEAGLLAYVEEYLKFGHNWWAVIGGQGPGIGGRGADPPTDP